MENQPYNSPQDLIDVSRIVLPSEISALTEKIAKNIFDAWTQEKLKAGWTYGKDRDDASKKDPFLLPYEQLPDSEKSKARLAASETLKAIYALGYGVEKKKSLSQRVHFFSYSTKDSETIDKIRALFEACNLKTWYAPENIRNMGKWESQIQDGMSQSDVFLVFLSANSLASQEVKKEIDLALGVYAKRFDLDKPGQSKIVPILIDQSVASSWRESVRELNPFELFDLSQESSFVQDSERLMTALGVKYPPRLLKYGSLQFPIYIYVGGDGRTTYQSSPNPDLPSDIIVDLSDHEYSRPANYPEQLYENIIARLEKEARENNRNLHNSEQIRFKSASWGTSETRLHNGEENKPLRLMVEWVKYYNTQATNFSTGTIVDPETKQTVEELLWTPIEDFTTPSLYADPFTTNLSVVTSDGYVLLKTRSKFCAGNPGEYELGMRPIQPAVSGSGSQKDCDVIIDPVSGNQKYVNYDPFKTAIREAREEIIGDAIPEDKFTVKFFGLARVWRTRFPFLFGELRLKEHTMKDIVNLVTETHWEGEPLAIKFNIDSVTSWIRDNYYARPSSRFATTYFSLIQSLIYEYPDKIKEINDKLTF